MKIELIHYTPIEPLIEACNMPYQSKGSERLVGRVWNSGHRSIARHSVAIFKITNISQSLLRQISRHPHINLTVKSSRYCNMEEDILKGVMPPFIKEDDQEVLLSAYENSKAFYDFFNKSSMDYTKEQKREISKLVLPLGSTTDLIISGNYQALYEFLQLRLCSRSEWEIREVAKEMRKQLIEVMPAIFKDLDCKGKELRYCPEHISCGKYPRKE